MEGEIIEAIFQLIACMFEAIIELPGLLERRWARWTFGILTCLIIAGGIWLTYWR